MVNYKHQVSASVRVRRQALQAEGHNALITNKYSELLRGFFFSETELIKMGSASCNYKQSQPDYCIMSNLNQSNSLEDTAA